MGIDVYLQWDGQTEAEKAGQVTGFSAKVGRAGYLREAYHGGPYATHILAREAFESPTYEAQIPAAVLRERLTHVTEPARGKHLQGGEMLTQLIKNMMTAIVSDHPEISVSGPDLEPPVGTDPQTVEECVRVRCSRIYPDMPPEEVEEYVQSFRDFVALAEFQERKTGKPCTVYASY